MKFSSILVICLLLFTRLQGKNYHDLKNEPGELHSTIQRIGNKDLTLTVPEYVFEGTETRIEIKFNNPKNPKLVSNNYSCPFFLNGEEILLHFDTLGKAQLSHVFKPGEKINLLAEDFSYLSNPRVISLWMILTPVGLVLLFILLKIFIRRNKTAVA